jgi:prevent-host-death family protein
MEKIVSAFEARRNFGKVLQDVLANGDKVIVERHGEPVAVVVPVAVYEQWQRNRQEFFDKVREMAEHANVPEAEAEVLVKDAIKAVRSRRRYGKST